MNRAEKKAKAKAAKRAAKEARHRKNGGKSRYARKEKWRVRALDGAPIPVCYPGATFEEAQRLYNAGVGLMEVATPVTDIHPA